MSRLYEKGQKTAFWKHNKGKNHYLCSNQYGSNDSITVDRRKAGVMPESKYSIGG